MDRYDRAKKLLLRRLYVSRRREATIAEQFHLLFYNLGEARSTWTSTRWMGVPTLKLPLDLWVYQEILHEVRPDLIIETGTAFGGSALFLAGMCDLLGTGAVLTIDIEAPEDPPENPRIEYVTGSSLARDVIAHARERATGKRVLVVLDSDHRRDHVLAELRTYAPLVTAGSYCIVEDSNVNGHPVFPDHGPGPWEAVDAFLAESSEFEIDTSRERFLISFNPRGYLRRRR